MKAVVPEHNVALGLGLLPEELARAQRNPKHRRFGTRTKGWSGHLIVGTEHNWLIDPTFDTAFVAFRQMGYDCSEQETIMAVQCDKEIDPLGFHMEGHFGLDDGNQLEVTYLSSPDEEYRNAPAWETDHLQILIRQICEAICRMANAPVITPTGRAEAQTR